MVGLPSDDSLKTGIDVDGVDNKAVINIPGGAEDATESNVQGHPRILRKADWHILPLISLLYFLSFMDRVNIGNARIAGMGTDLNLHGLRYNTASAIFFVTYCLAQAPSNVSLKFFRPSRWIPAIMFTWGLIMTLMCLVKTYPQLLVARLFLGFAEAGLFPGVAYYLSFWYPRDEMAKRIAMFTAAATIAGTMGGFLAYGIEQMDGLGGLRGWQWIFCVEGLATLVAAFGALFLMYDYPESASFLTESERHYIIELMKTDSQGLATHYNFQFVLQALKDYKTYLQFVILFGFGVPAYAIALFTPTIINELGYSVAASQLLSALPYATGCAAMIITGFYSDRRQLRGPFVVAGACVALAGAITMYTQRSPGVALAGIVLTATGSFPCVPVIIAWTSANAGGDVKRAVAIGIVSGLANTGGICASFIFFDAPRYHVGIGVCIGLLSCSLLLSLFTMWDYNRINKKKEKWCDEHGITDDLKDEFKEKGDDSPLFRYTL